MAATRPRRRRLLALLHAVAGGVTGEIYLDLFDSMMRPFFVLLQNIVRVAELTRGGEGDTLSGCWQESRQ